MDAARLAAAQKMVLQLLEGQVSQQTHPHLWDDDLLYINVRLLESHDVAWLMGQLADKRHTPERRLELARNMAGPEQPRALELAAQA